MPPTNLWAEFYRAAQLDTVPLAPGSKKCELRGWATGASRDLWARADRNANIAVRGGGHGLLILDCDSFQTAEILLRWMDGMGLDAPGAVTRRGQHIYIRTDVPGEVRIRKLSGELEGEVRGHHAYAVAPPSIVDDWQYRPVGDVRRIPVVEWRDVRWMLRREEKARASPVTETPIPLLKRDLPMRAKRLAAALEQSSKGQPVDKYPTRSEALWAFWAIGISAGQPYQQLRRALGDVSYTDRWLKQDYRRAMSKMQTVGARPTLRTMYEMAPGLVQHPDPRRQKTDTAVLRGAISAAWSGAGKDRWVVHSKDVARAAGIHQATATRAMRRLASMGLLTPVLSKRTGKAWGYQVNTQDLCFSMQKSPPEGV